MKRLLLLLTLVLVAGISFAAMSSYTFGQTAASYTELANPTVIHGVAVDDAMSGVLNIGFIFKLDGIGYSTFKANSNGFITLNPASSASLTNALASQTLIIAGIWDDLKTDDANASVSYELTGSQPSRILKVQFKNVKWYYNASPLNLVNFQIWLHESTNLVEIVYGTLGGSPGGSASASCGISGAVAGNYLSVTPATPTATVSSTTEFTAINGTHVPYMMGNKYTFTPPAPSAAPNVAGLVSPADAASSVFASSTLNWSDGGGWTEGFKLLFSETSVFPPATPIDLGYVNTYDPPGEMNILTNYSWKIIPYNSYGDNTSGPVWTFTTADAPLTGTKIIGTTEPYDYVSFTAAITALNSSGVGTGGVIFNVQDGVYAENPPAITVSGTSSSPVVFQPVAGANPVLTPAGGALTYGFKLDGADYVSFDNIDVTGPNTLIYGYWLANGAQNNTIKNSTITVPYGTTANYGIYSYYSAGNPNSYCTILNNNIVSPYSGIYMNHASGVEAQGVNVQGNTLSGIRNYAIYVYYAQNSTIQYNNIGFYSGGTTAYYGIYLYGSSSTLNVHHNTISGGYTSSTVYGIYNYYTSSTFDNNTVSNLYNTSSSSWYGFYDNYAGTTLWTNNQITGITNTGTSSFYGFYGYYSTNSTWNNNTLSGITITSGSMYASYMNSCTTSNFYNNTVSGLAGTGTIYGLYITGGTTNNAFANKIHNISYNGISTGIVYGIYISSGATNNVYNNMVYDLRSIGGTTSPQIRALTIAGGTTDNIWNNTVYLNATGTAGGFSTAALYVSSGTTIDLKNNIFVNKSIPGATGYSVAFWKTTAGVGNLSAASNKNIYYAGEPGTSNLIGYFNSVPYQDLAAYKTMAVDKDQGSYSEDVPFASPTRIIDLHINPLVATRVEGNGIAIQPPVTHDIDGDVRDASTPDIGADEGDFTPVTGLPSAAVCVSPQPDATMVPITANLIWASGSTGGTPTGYHVYFGASDPPAYILDQTATSYDPELVYGGVYYWKIVPYNGDGDALDCPTWMFTVQPDPRVSLPYTENFDGGAPNLAIAPAASWVIGTPAKSYLNAAYSAPNALVTTSLTALYNNNESSTVTVQVNTDPLVADVIVEFKQKFVTESGWDGMVFEYSINNQASWTKWDAVVGTGANFDTAVSQFWYNNTSTSGPVVPPKWSGNNSGSLFGDDINGWLPTHTVIPYSLFGAAGNLSLRWRFGSDSSGTYEGFAIDDISIRQVLSEAPGHVTLASPADEATDVNFFTGSLSWNVSELGGTPTGYEGWLSTDPDAATDPNTLMAGSWFESVTPNISMATIPSHTWEYSTTYYWGILPSNIWGSPDPEDPGFNIFSFTTVADPAITSLPQTQNFDGVTAPALPLGWTAYKSNSSTSLYSSTTYSQSAPNSVYMYNYTTTDVMRLISPQMLVPMNSIKLSFWARGGSAGPILKVGTVTALDGTGVFTEIGSFTLTATMAQYYISFASAGAAPYLCFQHGVGSSYQSIYLDSVLIEELMANDLAATAISGPGIGVVGTPQSYNVTVMNNGTAVQNAYNVHLKRIGDDRYASITVTDPLAPGASVVHSIPWTPTDTQAGNYQLVGEVDLTGDGNASNDESAPLSVSVYPAGTFIPQVGDINSTTSGNYMPFDMFYKNSVWESIYLPHELQMTGGTIQAIIFQNNFTQDLTKPVKVWMKHVTDANVATAWLPSDGYTLVYQGDVHFPLGVNAVVIPLQTPFVYTGGNLAIRAYRVWENVYWNSSNEFYNTSSLEYPNRSRYYYADDTGPIDPILMLTYSGSPYTGTATSGIPNTAFIVSPATPITYLNAPVVTATVAGANVALNWPVVAGAYSYRVYASALPLDPSADWGIPIATVHTNSYSMTATPAMQFFKVVAITTYRNVDLGLVINPAAAIGFDNSRVKAEPAIGKTDRKD